MDARQMLNKMADPNSSNDVRWQMLSSFLKEFADCEGMDLDWDNEEKEEHNEHKITFLDIMCLCLLILISIAALWMVITIGVCMWKTGEFSYNQQIWTEVIKSQWSFICFWK